MITDESLICAACGYMVYGLPDAGLCPECGGKYVVRPVEPARALAAFCRCIPRPLRLWREASLLGARDVVVRRFFVLGLTTLLTAGFVVAQVLIAYLRYRLSPPWGKDAIGSTVAEAGAGSGFQVHVGGCINVFIILVVGQIVVVRLLDVWWRFDAWRFFIPRDLARSLFRTVSVMVPVLMIIPMSAVLGWQVLNWWMPAPPGWPPSFLGVLPIYNLRLTPPDVPLLVGGAALLLSVTVSAVLLVRLNHRALRAIRLGNLGVRRVR
ncbi:MAG: hypothetical protein JXB13_18310 [Phycisphaerae bacterium]|nr:hypothetical protein [Phycisphaerae bacterium]